MQLWVRSTLCLVVFNCKLTNPVNYQSQIYDLRNTEILEKKYMAHLSNQMFGEDHGYWVPRRHPTSDIRRRIYLLIIHVHIILVLQSTC